jgi:hypothetical protein
MPELELTRTKDDRRLYSLEGVGTLHLQGLLTSAADASAGGTSWRFVRRGFWRRAVVATNAAGAPAGEFEPNTLRRGGSLRWKGRRLALRPAAIFRERYALVDGDEELAVIEGKAWGRRPVRITVPDGTTPEPGLLLFAAFVVRGLADDASGAAGAAAATAPTR